nr:Centromere kinetochore protein Zw10 domain containing protein [Haemonchus contortus]
MLSELEELEREIDCDLEKIAKGLQERYVEFQPLLKVAEEDLVMKLEDLSSTVNEKLHLADSFLRENSMDSSGEQKSRLTLTAQDRALRKKLADLSECRQLLDKFQNIEALLIACRSNSLSKIHEATNLLECESLLNEITQDDGWPILTGRCRDMLRDEISFMMKSLVCTLTCSFDEFVSYPSTEVKGTVHMHIRNSDSKETSEVLAALSLVGELDRRMKKWASYIVKNFIQPIIDSENGVDPYERFSVSNNTAEFTASSKVRPTVRGISLEGIVGGLKRFFTHLASAIDGIVLNNRPLSLCLGGFLQEDLMTIFLKQCVAASIPVPDSDGSKLKHAMEIAEQFRKDMIELGFFNDATPTFQAFSEQHFTVFIDRRCLEVIKTAKELICMPYLELAEVGIGEEVSEETILQYKEAFGKTIPKSVTSCDSVYPLLLQLPRCKVSQSTVDLMELVFCTLNDAVATDNEKLSARLTLTARNVVQLFELTAPRHHGTAISSMPQMAAIFYNNCYYICHRLMLLPFSVLKGVNKQSEKYANVRLILTDSLWKLRELGADMLEQTIRQCRRDISVMLVKDDLFVKIDDLERCDETKDVLNACLKHVQTISRLLKEVLAEMVYSQTMANIVSFLLDSICDVILRMEDIRSVDADISADMVDNLLTELAPIFAVNGRSAIHEICSTSYFRMKEIIFCLKGSLQSIDDRWCSAKGPLAQWLQPGEVRSLIKALFMNTEQRRQLLDSIF